jgi:GNAT superfamily N-acetyltransferase
MAVTITDLTGPAAAEVTDGVARLRIGVFREWPYLYDGDAAYESEYLRAYTESRNAIIVAAHEGDCLVGAATGAPMEDHAEDFGAPLEARGFDLSDVFYCGESVLLPTYRGQGIGHAFFDRREAYARRLGRRWSCFCGVIRPDDHPLKPADYTPLDGFWRKRGYEILEGATARFAWKDVDQEAETEKPMRIWMRRLD